MRAPASIAAVKGFRDVLPDESRLWRELETTAAEVFARHDFAPIVLPVLERAELFVRSLGETTASWRRRCTPSRPYGRGSRCDRSLASAAGLCREGCGPADAARYWYAGPMFRRERPQRAAIAVSRSVSSMDSEPVVDAR
jgi:histidyl-tRNA synthetase